MFFFLFANSTWKWYLNDNIYWRLNSKFICTNPNSLWFVKKEKRNGLIWCKETKVGLLKKIELFVLTLGSDPKGWLAEFLVGTEENSHITVWTRSTFGFSEIIKVLLRNQMLEDAFTSRTIFFCLFGPWHCFSITLCEDFQPLGS